MTKLVQATLRAAETVRSLGGQAANPVKALIAYFEPILQDMHGQVFEVTEFATQVRNSYGWDFNSDAAEGFRVTFRSLKYLIPQRDSRGIPKTTENGNPIDLVSAPSTRRNSAGEFEEKIAQIIAEYRDFAGPLGFYSSSEEIDDEAIVNSIVSYVLDSLGDDAGESDRETDLTQEAIEKDKERYLAARFVAHVMEKGGQLAEDLELVYSVGLIAELADDFRSPRGKVKRSSVRVFLDSPVALDLLGTSGAAAAETTRSIVRKLQDLGCKVEIFEQTRQELVNTLYAVVSKEPSERTGETAESLMSGEIEEDFVWSIINDTSGAFRPYNIMVRTRGIDNAVPVNDYFTASDFDKLFHQYMSQYGEIKNAEIRKKYERRSQHDANAAALVCRLRGEDVHSDIFQSGYFFLTRNRSYARIAKNYCISENIIDDSCVGPFVTMHELAAKLWLRTGMMDSVVVPRRHLMASCARVLARNERVIGSAKRAILSLRKEEADAEKARMLEAILMQDRSMLMISDRVRGAMKSFGVEDIQAVVDEFAATEREKGKELGGEEIRLEYEALKAENENLRNKNNELGNRIKIETIDRINQEDIQKKKISDLEEKFDKIDMSEKRRYLRIMTEVNGLLKSRRLRVSLSVMAIILILVVLSSINQVWDFVGLGSDEFGDWAVTVRTVCLVSALLIGGVFLLGDMVLRLFRLESHIDHWLFRRWALRKVEERVVRRGVEEVFEQYPARYERKRLECDLSIRSE